MNTDRLLPPVTVSALVVAPFFVRVVVWNLIRLSFDGLMLLLGEAVVGVVVVRVSTWWTAASCLRIDPSRCLYRFQFFYFLRFLLVSPEFDFQGGGGRGI